MKTGARSDFGASRPAAGQAAYPPGDASAARRPPSADRIAALSALVESITEQIDAIEGAARRGVGQRSAPAMLSREIPSRDANLRESVHPMAEAPAAAPQPDRIGEIEARLAAIAAQMAAVQAGAEKPAPRRPAGLQSAIAEISARQQAIDGDGGRLAAIDSIAIEDAITALRSDIAALGNRLGSEARRSEEMDKALRADLAARLGSGGSDDAGMIDELRGHLDAIRQAVEASARETTLASIEAGYGHVIERLDQIVRRVPDREHVAALVEEVGRLGALLERAQPFRSMEGELEDIRNAIASVAATRIDTAVERQIAELRDAIERLAAIPRPTVDLGPIERELQAIRREVDGFAKGTDPVLLIRLEQQVASMHAMLEGVAERAATGGDAAIHRLEERMDALSGRFDAIIDLPSLLPSDNSGAAVAAIEGLRGELSEIRDHIVTREPARFDAIDEQMRALITRLDAATERDDNQSLAQLEAQVAALAEKFSEAGPGAEALTKVEENIGRLQSMLGDSRRETIEAARDVARSAVSELAQQLPAYPDDTLIRALRDDLKTLQAAALTSDRQHHETLEAVHDTLAKVVERIAQLEAEEPAAGPQPATRRFAEMPEDHRPLAPGSGKPNLTARPDLAPPADERQGDAEPRSADRKADFIAAARRAAQAAQAETVREQTRSKKADRRPTPAAVEIAGKAEEPAEAKPGPLARLGSVFRSRRRPIVLGIAAVLLALGAARYAPAVGDRLMLLTGGTSAIDYETVASVATPQPAAQAAEPADAPVSAALDETPDLVAPGHDAALAFEPASALASPISMPAGDGAAAPAEAAVVAAVATEGPSAALDVALVKQDAAKGDVVAAFELGRLFAEGNGANPDLGLAAEWYGRAAEGGLALAQYRLASLYERGEGVKRDPAAAEDWYRKASAKGNARAIHNLGVMVSEGANAAPDYAAAADLFIRAGNLGVADSQYNLGVLYARGLGVKVDLVQSYTWFALAAKQGDEDAGKRRDEVAKVLKPAELASARAAVEAFRPQPLDAAANQEPAPKPDWLLTASAAAPSAERTPFAGASLALPGTADVKG